MDCYESETAPPPSPANGAALMKQAEALGAVTTGTPSSNMLQSGFSGDPALPY